MTKNQNKADAQELARVKEDLAFAVESLAHAKLEQTFKQESFNLKVEALENLMDNAKKAAKKAAKWKKEAKRTKRLAKTYGKEAIAAKDVLSNLATSILLLNMQMDAAAERIHTLTEIWPETIKEAVAEVNDASVVAQFVAQSRPEAEPAG